jgi:hypothetical protein
VLREHFWVGVRVKLVRPVDCYPLGVFPVGTAGVVVSVEDRDGTLAEVKLDQRFACLDAWDDLLQVGGEFGAATYEDFAEERG